MDVKTRKLPAERNARTDRNGKDLPAYEIVVDGVAVGQVWAIEERATHTSGRIAVGFSYRKVWYSGATTESALPRATVYPLNIGRRTKTEAVDAYVSFLASFAGESK